MLFGAAEVKRVEEEAEKERQEAEAAAEAAEKVQDFASGKGTFAVDLPLFQCFALADTETNYYVSKACNIAFCQDITA